MTREYRQHTVEAGEDLVSIALLYGISADAIWNDEQNASVKKAVKNPFTLRPGDILLIPSAQPRKIAIATDRRHTFRRKGTRENFTLVLITTDGEPRAGIPYTLEVEDETFQGETDTQGRLMHPVRPTTRQGRLMLYTGEEPEQHLLRLGHLQPVETEAGLRSRLFNLGLLKIQDADDDTRALQAALEAFQRSTGLKVTGRSNAQTRQRLVEVHGS